MSFSAFVALANLRYINALNNNNNNGYNGTSAMNINFSATCLHGQLDITTKKTILLYYLHNTNKSVSESSAHHFLSKKYNSDKFSSYAQYDYYLMTLYILQQ